MNPLSNEIGRQAILRKYQEEVHEFRVILNPDVLKRLKEEDEELLIELERRYASRLMFRGDPTLSSLMPAMALN